MIVSIRGKRWRINWCRMVDYGRCDHPETPNKEIRIRKGMGPEDELSTLIHELAHAACFDLAEETVDEMSNDMARIIIRWLKEHKGVVIPHRKQKE